MGGSPPALLPPAQPEPQAPAPSSTPGPAQPAAVVRPSVDTSSLPIAEEKAYGDFINNLQDYMSRLTYMVYYSQEGGLDPLVAKQAVAQANRYILDRSKKDGLAVKVIDFAQIEKNKQDQSAAYSAVTGDSVDLIQFLAAKFNADIYIELDYRVRTETRDGKFYAATEGSMKMFDVASSLLLGSVQISNQPSFSPNSEAAAVANSVANAVWLSMPKLYDQSRELIKSSLERGVRYEVVIQKSSDSRKIMDLEKYLGLKFKAVDEASYSQSETKLFIFSFQKASNVRQAIFDAAVLAGMPDFTLVMSRNNSFTFNTGL